LNKKKVSKIATSDIYLSLLLNIFMLMF